MKILRCIPLLLIFAALAAGQTAGMSFTYKIGGFVPPPQTVDLTIDDGSVPNLVALVIHGDSWIVAVLNGAQSPCYLTVSVNPLNLATGNLFRHGRNNVRGGIFVARPQPGHRIPDCRTASSHH